MQHEMYVERMLSFLGFDWSVSSTFVARSYQVDIPHWIWSCAVETVISDLQIGVRGRVRVLSSEHAHFEKFRPSNLKRVLSTENSYS